MATKDERLVDSSGTFYLTLVSIIQSLAFGYFLQQMEETIISSGFSWLLALRSLTTFLAIILVWHEYAMGAAIYRWRIGMLDSIIPFGFAASQWFIIYFLSSAKRLPRLSSAESWLIAYSVFALVGTVAYWNQKRNIMVEEGKKPHARETTWGITLTLISAAMLLLMIPLGRLFFAPYQHFLALATATLVFGMCVMNALRIHFEWKTDHVQNHNEQAVITLTPTCVRSSTLPERATNEVAPGAKKWTINRAQPPILCCDFQSPETDGYPLFCSLKSNVKPCTRCCRRCIFNVDTGSKEDASTNSEVGP